MRQLSNIERERLGIFIEKGIETALIQPTYTGLKKSILDATSPVRRFLETYQIHNYDIQRQGPENKVLIPVNFIDERGIHQSNASLYRPHSKNGDPRIWFSGMPDFVNADDIISLFIIEGTIYIINITRTPVESLLYNEKNNILIELIGSSHEAISEIARELLEKLKIIAKSGPHRTINNSDTGVGETLENLLGIPKNSSKTPDYKGIELKTHRSSRTANRVNLFAQVANWSLSKFKSSREILENFGYYRDNTLKLYCEVSTRVRNSQGLKFLLDMKNDLLIENSNNSNIGDFAVWELKKLHNRLETKHKETFWIKSANSFHEGIEYFDYKSINHTRRPIASQFDLLIGQGDITMDHLIKIKSNNQVSEKGPLFKIKKNNINLLFPSTIEYNLN